MIKVENSRGAYLDLDPATVLGKGTTGAVYPHPSDVSLCIKIYDPSHAAAQIPKLESMIKSPPLGLVAQSSGISRVQAAWPIEAVRQSGVIVGFIMPRIDFGESWSLTEVLTMAEADYLPRRRLISFLVNLSGMVSNIHKVGHRLIDFNPANFRVYKADGFVGLIDCDGYQIANSFGGKPFSAEVAWAEHIAPVAMRPDGTFDQNDLNSHALIQDRWALALIAFRLLNRNIFPYDGIPFPGKSGQIPDTNELRILNCSFLYPYGSRPSKLLKPVNHSLHASFPTELRDAFDRTFQDGQPIPPDAWLPMLLPYRSGNRGCTKNPNHWHLGQACEQCVQSIVPVVTTQPLPQPPAPVPQPGQPHPIGRAPTGGGMVAPTPQAQTRQTNSGVKIAAGLGALIVAGWGFSRLLAHETPENPPYPIEHFATPLQEQVTSTKLNVRAGPGPSYPALKQVARGDHVRGLGTAKTPNGSAWQYVQLEDGSYGYINARMVQISPSGLTIPSAAEPATVVATNPPPPPPSLPSPLPSPPSSVPSPQAALTPVTTPEPSQNPPTDEVSRVRRIITSADFHRDQSPESGEIPGRSMIIRVDASYANARAGDVVQGGLMQNGQVVGRCNDIVLQESGTFWCRLPVFRSGNYFFLVGINGTQVLSHNFNITGTSPQVQQSTSPRNQTTDGIGRQIFGFAARPHR